MGDIKSKDFMMDMFGNNLLGQLQGGTNEILSDEIEKYMKLQDEKSYNGVIDALEKRLKQGAHIIIPGRETDNQLFIFSTWIRSGEEGDWFIGFTGRDRRDINAGRNILQIPLKDIMQIAVEKKVNGIVLNPVNGVGFMLRRNVIAYILNS